MQSRSLPFLLIVLTALILRMPVTAAPNGSQATAKKVSTADLPFHSLSWPAGKSVAASFLFTPLRGGVTARLNFLLSNDREQPS